MASRENWASVRGTPDSYLTHLFDCVVVVFSADADDVVGEVGASVVIAVMEIVIAGVVTVVGAIHV